MGIASGVVAEDAVGFAVEAGGCEGFGDVVPDVEVGEDGVYEDEDGVGGVAFELETQLGAVGRDD